jgi:ATPase complex subunit ATP10
MKAPSVLCLQALRSLALSETRPSCLQTARRAYASLPDSKNSKPSTTTPPPPPAVKEYKPPTDQPGYKLREKSDNSEEFTPTPLSRPIGMPNPPEPFDNMGKDPRSLRQRRDDFVNYDKHLARRSKMTKQIAKPYFRDWSNLRFHKGKQFIANARLFRAEHALFFPNFFGQTLRKDAIKNNTRDGYGGLGRNTCEAMEGKISVVSIASNQWAINQVNTFCSKKENPALHETLRNAQDCAQMVEINWEENWLKWWIVQFFKGNLRKQRTLEEQGRYFMVRRGVSDIMKEAIGLLNDKTGYVYLVDEHNRIRWAGSAIAEPQEKESLYSGLNRLIQEARMPNSEKPVQTLEDAVTDVIEDESRTGTK